MDSGYYTTGEKEFLLKIARQSLEKFLLTGEKFEPQTVNRKLWEKRGVFVTLNKDRQPRSSIGNIEPIEALILAIRNNVVAAASEAKFSHLEINDLDFIEIEISILSSLQKVNLGQIKPGDGVLIKRRDRQATYLPQIWKTLTDKNKFISSLGEKAGLNPSFYDDSGTEFWVYKVISFSRIRT